MRNCRGKEISNIIITSTPIHVYVQYMHVCMYAYMSKGPSVGFFALHSINFFSRTYYQCNFLFSHKCSAAYGVFNILFIKIIGIILNKAENCENRILWSFHLRWPLNSLAKLTGKFLTFVNKRVHVPLKIIFAPVCL